MILNSLRVSVIGLFIIFWLFGFFVIVVDEVKFLRGFSVFYLLFEVYVGV